MIESAGILAPDIWEGRFWLPRGPLASNDPQYEGVFRHSRATARTMRFIEANPKVLVSQIIIDIDKPDALMRAYALKDRGIVPNLFAHSQRTGHGQAFFLIGDAVAISDAARLAPMNLLARCQGGLTHACSGDRHYSGPLARNPLHEDARTHWGRAEPYGLRELARGLGGFLPARAGQRAEQAVASALGRNCWLFQQTSRWGARAWTRYPRLNDWQEAVYAYAWARNAALVSHPNGPLAFPEVASVARSVAAYVWKSDNRRKGVEQFEADFKVIQANRGRCNKGKPVSEKKRKANSARRRKFDLDQIAEELL
jgi:hypothetical protein